jgi:hypothetical protein
VLDRDGGEDQRARGERGRVGGETPAGARHDNDDARQRRPCDVADRARERPQRVGRLQPLGRHYVRDQACLGGQRECLRATRDRLQEHDVPDLRVAAEQQRRREALADGHDGVGDDHHRPRPMPIGDHAAAEQEHDQRDLPRRQDEPDTRGVGDVQHGEHQRHRRDERAEERDRLGGEHPPKAPIVQREVIRNRPHPRGS